MMTKLRSALNARCLLAGNVELKGPCANVTVFLKDRLSMMPIVSMRPRFSTFGCRRLLVLLSGAPRVGAAATPAGSPPDLTKDAAAAEHDQHPPQLIKLQDIAAGQGTQGNQTLKYAAETEMKTS